MPPGDEGHGSPKSSKRNHHPILPKAKDVSSGATVGFRLDDQSRHFLAERAARLGMSVHELARHYLIEKLSEPEERAELRQAILQLQHELTEQSTAVGGALIRSHQMIHRLREDIATIAEAFLIKIGHVPAKEANAWIEHVFTNRDAVDFQSH